MRSGRALLRVVFFVQLSVAIFPVVASSVADAQAGGGGAGGGAGAGGGGGSAVGPGSGSPSSRNGLAQATTPVGSPAIPTDVPEGYSAPPDMPAVSRSVTLEQALRRVSLDATDVRIAREQVERSRAAERIALAAVLPQLTGGLTYTRYDSASERMGIVVRRIDSLGGQVSLSEQLTPRGFNQTRIASANTQQSLEQARDSARLARASTARIYFSVLTARRNAELARVQLAATLRQYAATAARVRAGVALSLDRARAELAVLDALRVVSDGDASLARTRDQLGQSLAMDEAVDAVEITPPDVDEPLEHYLTRALGSRADLRALDAAHRSAELSIDDAWLRFVPTLGITWTLNWTNSTTTFSPNSVFWVAAATLTVPFFDGGARYGALRDAHAAVAQVDARIDALRRAVQVDVRDAWRRFETATRGAELARRSEEVAGEAAARAEASYRAGTLSGIELDESRRALREAQTTSLLRALDRHVAIVDLLAAAGSI